MEKKKIRLSFGRADAVVMVFILALAVFTGWIFTKKVKTEENARVVIYKDGEKVQEASLEKDGEISITGEFTNRIVIEDGRVCIAESDCPGEDCVHSGWIEDMGRSIICLPNRTEVRIEGDAEGDVDFMVR